MGRAVKYLITSLELTGPTLVATLSSGRDDATIVCAETSALAEVLKEAEMLDRPIEVVIGLRPTR